MSHHETTMQDPAVAEVKKEGRKLERLVSHEWFFKGIWILGGFLVIAILGYLYVASGRVYVEKSQVMAPTINLSPAHPGILEGMYVRPGQHVKENDFIARIDGEMIKAKEDGVIISANPVLGTYFNPGQPVATMYNPSDLRVYGQVAEDKGFKDVKVGERAVFTVDAFGSQTFEGVVDEIGPAAKTSDVVFSISDKREEQEFTIKIRYDLNAYGNLKPGMSARSWIYLR